MLLASFSKDAMNGLGKAKEKNTTYVAGMLHPGITLTL
jgi:hypothetical protein